MAARFDLLTFESLFKEHYNFLLLVSFQVVNDQDIAQDVVQQFFIDVWSKRNPDQIQNFQAYASRAVRNLSISHLRKLSTELSHKETYQRSVPTVELDDLSKTLRKEADQNTEDFVHNLVNLLPPKRRQVFLDFVVHGLSYEQIAEKHGVSINTVKTQMQRSYQFLKKHVANDRLNPVFLGIILHAFLINI